MDFSTLIFSHSRCMRYYYQSDSVSRKKKGGSKSAEDYFLASKLLFIGRLGMPVQ